MVCTYPGPEPPWWLIGKMEVTTPGSGRMERGVKKENLLSSSSHYPAKLVCTVAVFAQCGLRTAWGHPKGPISLCNNTRKSMKGQSDKVEINQLVHPQDLRSNLRSNKRNYIQRKRVGAHLQDWFHLWFLCYWNTSSSCSFTCTALSFLAAWIYHLVGGQWRYSGDSGLFWIKDK